MDSTVVYTVYYWGSSSSAKSLSISTSISISDCEVVACEGAVLMLMVQPCTFPKDTLGLDTLALVSSICWDVVLWWYSCSMYEDCVGVERRAETGQCCRMLVLSQHRRASIERWPVLSWITFFRDSSVIHLCSTCCSKAMVCFFCPQYQQVCTISLLSHWVFLPTGMALYHGLVGLVGTVSRGRM